MKKAVYLLIFLLLARKVHRLSGPMILTIVMLCLEFLCMQARDHFMNLMVYTAIICTFFLGYFDRTYMKSILIMLVIAMVLDLAWLIIMAPVSLHLS